MDKIFDCFIFFNEFEILKIRLEELYNTVDKFILVEADKTFSGKQKPLFFQEHKKDYEKYSDKIIHIVVTDMPESPDPWVRESFQRNQIIRGLNEAQNSDIILVSDVDEIPNVNIIKNYKEGLCKLSQTTFYYFLNLKGHEWNKAAIGRWNDIKKYESIDAVRYIENVTIIPNGGWHFSYLGGWQSIKTKLESFSHQEYNNEKYNSKGYITQCINTSTDLIQRKDVHLEKVEIDSSFPKYIMDHLSYYQSIGYIKNKEKKMISIVIPTCTYELVKPCIDSIVKYTDLDNIEIIVVANGAEKEIKDILGIKLLWFDDRIGAPKALNEGIKSAKGEYIVLLNDDVELLEQQKNSWIEMLLSPFSDPKVGITGPLKNISPSVGQEFIVFFCVMIKKNLFDEIGLLDETFQCGCDMDFCMRIKEKGYSLIQVPNNLLTTGPQFWGGNFPIWHKGEKTVHIKIPPEEWGKIFWNDTERLVKRYGVGKKIDFSIIIPTCTFELLHKCISSLVSNTDLSNTEVIIVSNGAEEKTKEFVYSLGNQFHLIWFDKRIGATKALNEGIKVAKGEYIVLLNDDVTILGKEWILMLMKPFADEDVGITGPILGTLTKETGYHDSILGRQFMIFFCCAIRKKVFDEIGLLDEIFSPGIFEDVDFGFRAEDVGWKAVQVPNTKPIVGGGVFKSDFPIWHKEGTTVTTTENFWGIYKRNLKIINNRYGTKTGLNCSIVIPTCTLDLLKGSISSIISAIDLSSTEIIIVANGAEPETKEYVNNLGNSFKLIWFDNKIGATRAINEGIKISNGKYIIILNDDVSMLDNRWFSMLLEPFKDPKVGITGPMLVTCDSVGFHDIDDNRFDISIRGRKFIPFFCCAIKKETFDNLGILDEQFNPGGFEDVDFCLRVEDAGLKVVQVPDNAPIVNGMTVGGFPIYHLCAKNTFIKLDNWQKIFEINLDNLNKKHSKYKKIHNSIVIPTCTFELLHKCISSLVSNTDLSNTEVIIVSNGASIETKEYANNLGSSFRLLWFDTKIGYTRGINEGIKVARGKYVILLNDDNVILGKNWISILLEPFKDPKVGITGPIVARGTASPWELQSFVPSTINRKEGFVSFFCCAIRKQLFNELGLPDEIFSPGGFEDVDFSYRSSNAGWKFVQVPDDNEPKNGHFPIWHAGSSTMWNEPNYNKSFHKNLEIIKERYGTMEEKLGIIKIDWPCDQKIPELNMLQEFIKGHKIERVFEIGTHWGGTAVLWSKIVEPYNGKVYCADLHFNYADMGPDLNLRKHYNNRSGQVYSDIPQKKFITELQGNSHDIDFKKKVHNEVEQVDLLFIDGDHSYEGVKDDFETYSKLVKPGGFVVFHDIIDSEYNKNTGCFVPKFWNEIKNNYEYKEFIDSSPCDYAPVQSMGIGILKMPDIIKVDYSKLPNGCFSDQDISVYKSLIGRVSKEGKIAEIGVWKGRSLCSISEVIKDRDLQVVAVDTFEGTVSEGNTSCNEPAIDIQNIFENNLKQYKIDDRTKIIKGDSSTSANLFPDNYFDCVFIDADHEYNAIKKDLDAWWSKVKPGGILSGHDFVHIPITKALKEKFGENNIHTDTCNMWYVDKPI